MYGWDWRIYHTGEYVREKWQLWLVFWWMWLDAGTWTVFGCVDGGLDDQGKREAGRYHMLGHVLPVFWREEHCKEKILVEGTGKN